MSKDHPAWKETAVYYRNVLASINIDVPDCLPGELQACGHGYAEHTASYLGTLKAWVQSKIDHLPPKGQHVAENIAKMKIKEIAMESDHGRHLN